MIRLILEELQPPLFPITKKSIYLLFNCLLVLKAFVAVAQPSENNGKKTAFINKFREVVADEQNISYLNKVKQAAAGGNALNFLYLSYNINARNIMFKATGDITYLKENFSIITNILDAGKRRGHKNFIWLAHSRLPDYTSVNKKEVVLYEGYLFRYVAEYQYLVGQHADVQEFSELQIPVKYTESVFLKWYERSVKSFKDDSRLQHVRTHIGAHWAIVAMYLYKLSDNSSHQKIYHDFFTRYDSALKRNLKTDTISGAEIYQWNQTYDQPFTNMQKKDLLRIKNTPRIQDVLHGSHVIAYILSAYELGLNNWSNKDIERLSNVVKYKMWDKTKLSFSVNIDGSAGDNKAFQNSGWKQSDGWMKLLSYDQSLYPVYLAFYESKKAFIDKTYANIQFYANFVCYYALHSAKE